MSGSTFKRCPHGKGCPDLVKRRHGSWFWAIRLDTGTGRQLVRRGGFPLERDAAAQLERVRELIALAGADDDARRQIGDMITERTLRGGQLPDADTVRRRLALGADPGSPGVTLGEWLDSWLKGRRKLRESVVRSYRSHIELWLKPNLGHIPLERLRAPHIDELFDTIERINAEITGQRAAGRAWIAPAGDVRKSPTVVGIATQHRIFATLRAARNAAVRQRQIPFNPAMGVELEPETRSEAPRWAPRKSPRPR